MTTRIGINGFGRIGRDYLRYGPRRFPTSTSWRSTTSPTRRRWPGCCATTARSARCTARSRTSATSIAVDGHKIAVSAVQATRPSSRGGTTGSRSSSSRPASSAAAIGATGHLTAGAPKVLISAPGKDVDATIVLGVNDETYDADAPPDHLQRLVHDQLRRADGQGAQRQLRHRPGLHDHGARVHQRPERARRRRTRTRAGPAPRRSTSSRPRPAPPARSARSSRR